MVRRHLGQTPFDLCQELLGADTHGSNCFQCHSKKSRVPLNKVYLFLFLTAAVSAALALVMALCYREAFPRVSTTVTSQVALRPEFHGRMSNRQAACRLPGPARVVPSSWERRLFVGVLHGCRPSSSVVFCNGCIVAKRYKIGPKLLSITNRKSNTGFQMTLKSMTLDDLERTMVCQSCGIVHTVSRNNQHDMHRARQSS